MGSFFDALQAPGEAPIPGAGSDRELHLPLAFEVAVLGGKREVELSLLGSCPSCGGAGGLPEPKPRPCHVCRGTGAGRETRLLGAPRRPLCPLCRGEGLLYPRLCADCEATGRIERRRTLELDVPPGSATGDRIRVAGRGEPGRHGGPPGDLYVILRVEEHPLLQRAGRELHIDVPLSVGEATRGARIDVPTLTGPREVAVPPCAPMPYTARLSRLGVPGAGDGRERGDLCVHFFVEAPRLRTAEQRDAVARLEQPPIDETYPARARYLRLTEEATPD